CCSRLAPRNFCCTCRAAPKAVPIHHRRYLHWLATPAVTISSKTERRGTLRRRPTCRTAKFNPDWQNESNIIWRNARLPSSYDYIRDGAEIYRRSFAIIRQEADLARFEPVEERVAVRIIH